MARLLLKSTELALSAVLRKSFQTSSTVCPRSQSSLDIQGWNIIRSSIQLHNVWFSREKSKKGARVTSKKEKHYYVNEAIKANNVRLVEGESHSIVSLKDALKNAGDVGQDLVQVGLDGEVPVCKVMNYVEYVLEENRKQEAKTAASVEKEVKEKSIRIGYATCRLQMHMLAMNACSAPHELRLIAT
jgi:hypothetical protein